MNNIGNVCFSWNYCIKIGVIYIYIYTSKIWNMPIKKIAEFNYKLSHRIITCRYLVSKWKNEVTPYCLYCHDIETV